MQSKKKTRLDNLDRDVECVGRTACPCLCVLVIDVQLQLFFGQLHFCVAEVAAMVQEHIKLATQDPDTLLQSMQVMEIWHRSLVESFPPDFSVDLGVA